jgi:hypothetical protein
MNHGRHPELIIYSELGSGDWNALFDWIDRHSTANEKARHEEILAQNATFGTGKLVWGIGFILDDRLLD